MDLLTDLLNLTSSILIYIIPLVIISYLILCFIVLLILTNNVFFFKKTEPIFPFRTEKKTFINSENTKMTYWVTKSINHRKWVIFLHYYGGSSQDMIERGKTYRKNNFSLLFVDARSHGSSGISTRSTAYFYALDVLEIIEHEDITNFNIHGVSLGGFATLIVSKIIKDTNMNLHVNGIVVEAISKDLKNVFWYLLDYSPFPRKFFAWIPYFLYFHWRDFDWVGNGPDRILTENHDIPVFLIHGENDPLYDYKKHFFPLQEAIFEKKIFLNKKSRSWLVKDCGHLEMDLLPQYSNRLTEFLSSSN